MEKAQGFEITEYSDEHDIPGRIQGAIAEIVRDSVKDNPSVNIGVTFTGNLMRLTYRSYEQDFPNRGREIERYAKVALDQMFKLIKKELKEKVDDVPKITEKKDMSDYDVQKVSLNNRYMYSTWRFYEIE